MDDRGLALVLALMAMLLLMALGLALVLNTAAENMIAGTFRRGQEAFYAAEAGVDLAISDLGAEPDWTGILRGARRSAFTDGAPSGVRLLSDGATVDLTEATNMANCGHAGACTVAEMDRSTADRPWGMNNPRWILYAYGPLSAIVPTGTVNSNMYVVVWVGDDQSENDDDPTADGDSQGNPGSGVLMVHAEAFGPRGTHRVVEVTIARARPPQSTDAVRMLSWRELR